MKKKITKPKRLKLSKSTIVRLNSTQTNEIVGGSAEQSFVVPICPSSCLCPPTTDPTGCATC